MRTKALSESRCALAAWMLLSIAPSAVAGPLLRPANSPVPGSSAAAAASARAAQLSEALARQTNRSLQDASEAVRRFQAQQDAARAAAALGGSNVPNGLTTGGLVIAPGAGTTEGLWTGANLPTQSQNGQRTEVAIGQTQSKAILTWETFNVGRETDVHFDQTAGGADATQWIALNRVSDPNARPSQILGSIRSEGQVYLINPNGIVFGGTSQVNVNSLIASSLDFYGTTLAEKNQRFLNGILFNPNEAFTSALVFGEKLENTFDELRADPNANHNPTETFARGDGVTIEAGARLTASGGRAMVLGHNVVNAGAIQATDGEVVLAAGRGIYLNKNFSRGYFPTGGPLDSNIRGLTIGVNRGGSVENSGIISCERGSISIQGKSILQGGLLNATTSASANGYINLTAGDGVSRALGTPYPDPTNYTTPDVSRSVGVMGNLTFGEGSRTQILPDANGELAIGFDQFKPSSIEMFGRYVTFGHDSTLFAPGATVKIDAQRGPRIHDWTTDPGTGRLVESPDDARIYLDRGARIDLSGLRGIDVRMERNTIQAEMRANELRDNPILRDSFLRGQKVYFDARKGISIADASGYYDLIARSVAELMTQGGSIQLKGPQIITRAGSVIDVSGGSLNYLPGYVRSTRLVDYAGNVVSIEDADPNVEYVGFAGDHLVSHARWGVMQSYSSPFLGKQGLYQAGYIEGRSAGTLTIGQTNYLDFTSGAYGYRIFDGDVVADAVVGPNQRGAPTGATNRDVTRVWRERPIGATLNFGYLGADLGTHEHPDLPPIGGNIVIGQAPLLPDGFAFDSRVDPSAEYNHVLPARYFDGKTFSVVNLYSGQVGAGASAPGGRLTINEGTTVDLGDYGKLNFIGTRADIGGAIRAPGGSVNITAARVAPRPVDPNDPGTVPDWRTLDEALKPQINLGPTAEIDVAGRWVNQFVNAGDRSQLSINGGSVRLVTSNNLNLAVGSLIDVSGGGRLSADGRKVTAGRAGSISLINSHAIYGANGLPSGPRDGALNLGATLRGFGLQGGGSLTIATGKSVLITDQAPIGSNALVLSPDFFRQGGFANFTVSGASGTTVADNTLIASEVKSFVLDGSGQSIGTGARLFGAARLGVFTDDLAQPMSLTLSAPAVDANGDLIQIGPWSPSNVAASVGQTPGAVTVATGARILMAPKSTVRLISFTNVFVDGTVSTPGGLIDLRVGVDALGGSSTPAVRLGQNARLLANGYVKSTREGLFTRRSVEDGGTVRIGWLQDSTPFANPVGFIMTDVGSIIDVSGIQGPADFAAVAPPMARPADRYIERAVDGGAGSISIRTDFVRGLGGILAGQLLLAPGGATGRGGSLEIGAPQLTLTQSVSGARPVTAESPIDRTKLDLTVFADRVNASGTDDLTLRVTGNLVTRALVFDGNVSLFTRRSITLGGPLIAVKPGSAGTVTVSSEYVRFSPRNFIDEPVIAGSRLAESLGGSLTVAADLIDVGYGVDFGCSSVACMNAGVNVGFADVRLVSRGDIRLDSQGITAPGSARIGVGGTLTLDAAQVYVTSAAFSRINSPNDPGFLINADVPGGFVTIRGNGAPAPVPYSYGDRLTIRAPDIIQAGVLRAPLGDIRLEGSRSVTLAPGSLTSTSLEGLLLVGGYPNIIPNNPFPNLAPFGDLTKLPSKTVKLDAPNVTVSNGATIDVSGGGNVSAWQFSRGTGGSRNILRDPGTFAVLPGYGDAPLPAGWQSTKSDAPLYTSSPLRVGDKVYLEGMPGLPNGRYTLLPADYALLSGGVLLRTVGSGLAQTPVTTQRPDGSSLVGGYRLVDGTPIRDAAFTRFLAMPQSVFSKYSNFTSYSFNDFVATQAELIGVTARAGLDAGSVVLGARNNLVLNGTGRFDAAAGGLLGNLDISSLKIAIVGDGSSAPAGFLAVDATAVSRFGAGSVFIGGTRSPSTSGGTNLTINATDVIVSNTPNSALTGPEILIGARDTLTLAAGSAITAQGRRSGDSNALNICGASCENGIGNGAFLRASTGARVDVRRINATDTSGALNISPGAAIRSTGAIALDASNSVVLDSTAVLDAAQLDLSSQRVSIGDVPGSVTGTVLSGATLANLASTRDLLIRGRDSIDLYGTFHLGGVDASGAPTLGALTLDTPLLKGVGATGDAASIRARELTLRNSGSSASATALPAGSLVLDANKLILGPGKLALLGFATLSARTAVTQAVGIGGLDFTGSMALATDLVTAAAGSDYALSVGGNLSVARAGGAAQMADDFGGRLSLSGSNLNLDTTVDIPGGVFEAHATAGDLTLGSSATLKLQGRVVDFRDAIKATSGGLIRLAASGDVIAADTSQLNVSGDARGGDAGQIEIAAGGRVSLADQIKGTAAAGYRGGGFSLQSGTLSDFGHLNAALEAAGMNRSRSIRVASGDLSLGSAQSLTAHDVLLRSDNGAVSIAGTINAAGDSVSPNGGRIRLLGGNGVSIAGSARLDARAGSTRPGDFLADSGSVEIAATGGRLSVAQGAVVDVSGGKQGGGKVLVRALRDGNDVAIDRLDGQFIGARDLAIAGMRSYQTTDVNGVLRDALTDAATWMVNAPAILARLGTPAFEVRPGISIRSAGDLAISDDIDLSSARYGAGTPGYIEFNAAGDININGNLSDGFADPTHLSTGRSWSYNFEAGRDVNLNAINRPTGVMVRTGTGDIHIEAGRDLILGGRDPDLVLRDVHSVIYTAGSRTATEAGFEPLPDRVTGEFPTEGGNISLIAGRDILAPVTRQSASAWLFRYGQTNWTGDPRNSPITQQTSWSIVFENFEQGVGALGGGSVDVTAGRDIAHLAISLPTTGQMTTEVGHPAQEGDVHIRGGGNLTLRADRDLLGGVFLLGQGAAEVNVGGRLTSDPDQSYWVAQRNTVQLVGGQPEYAYTRRPLAALFGLADATLTVNARAGAEIEGVFDPMLQGQICQNSGCDFSLGHVIGITAGSAFFGMTERTAMSVTSVSGNVQYNANPWASVDVSHLGDREAFMFIASETDSTIPKTTNAFARAPGTVRLAALHDDVVLANKVNGNASSLLLAPTDNGTVELLAKNGVSPGLRGALSVTMLDVGADYRRGARNAFAVTADTRMGGPFDAQPSVATNYDRGFIAAHLNDRAPARLFSMTRSFPSGISVTLPKPMSVYSGRDLISGSFRPQNNRADDVSSFVAERDVTNLQLIVTGIGDAVVEAGHNIKLGNLSGIDVISAGDFPNRLVPSSRNLALPANKGANIYMYAGAASGTDYDGFTAAYLDPQNSAHVVRTYLGELATYMAGLGFGGLSDPDLVARFRELPLQSRKAFGQQIFFTELKETGLDVTDLNSLRFQSYQRGYAAIQRLFPRDPSQVTDPERSNIFLNARRVETQAGGNISILAPYGRVEIGAVNVLGTESSGVVTRKGGSIRIMADRNVDLFASRVFTLQGGDVTIWSSNGDITAGVGSKTTIFRPPLAYNLDNDGRVSLNIFGLQTGSGIGVLDAGGSGQRVASRLDLIAPKGEVNAGDAGIRAVGDLNIAALRVVGIDNIQASGRSLGVPKVIAPNIVALTEADKILASATEKLGPAGQPKTKPEELPSIVSVEVIGYEAPAEGEGNPPEKRRRPDSGGDVRRKR